MKTTKYNQKQFKDSPESKNLLIDSVKVLSDLTQRDIDRSYNNEKAQVTEIDYNNRYGDFQRRIIA